MKSFSSLLIICAVFALYSCEKCSTCTITNYSGTCSCNFGTLGTTDIDYDDISESEFGQAKTACNSTGFCTFTDTSEDDEKEECGKKKDVEAEVDDLEDDGWECSSIE
ncbi:MAG: hypothetical protein R2813_06070 [Flavobacteriales bacterium]